MPIPRAHHDRKRLTVDKSYIIHNKRATLNGRVPIRALSSLFRIFHKLRSQIMDSGTTDAPAVAEGVKMAVTRERLFDFAVEDIRGGTSGQTGLWEKLERAA